MNHDIVNKFSTNLKNVLTRALCFVSEQSGTVVEPQHLLWALGTQNGCVGAQIMEKADTDTEALRDLVDGIINSSPDPSILHTDPAPRLSKAAKRAVEKAVLVANKHKHSYVGTEHLLSGLMQISHTQTHDFLTTSVDHESLKKQLGMALNSTSKFSELTDMTNAGNNSGGMLPTRRHSHKTSIPNDSDSDTPTLDYFGTDLTNEDQLKRIDPVIGREKELTRVMEILSRRTKNNPVLLGEPGVGKTAIVEGLAKKIAEDDVSIPLRGKRIVALDFASILAGTMYRGEFEGRLKQIVEEVRNDDDIILFIDEIHTMSGAGAASGSVDAANILKPALARGEIRCIGSTTPTEYKQDIEEDTALERRFRVVHVEEPSEAEAVEILKKTAEHYETFHNVTIDEAAIQAAVTLSRRYIHNKFLPDKALDLIDEASAAKRVQMTEDSAQATAHMLKNSIKKIKKNKKRAVREERFLEAIDLKREEETIREKMRHNNQSDAEKLLIDHTDIAQTISKHTGVPVEQIQSDDAEKWLEMEQTLEEQVLGQSAVVEDVAATLRRAKTNINHPDRPQASFLFMGPSGVGKTELAKTIAAEVFHDRNAFIRIDMSEFSEGFTMSKLIGAPAGYVGYRESTKLTDRVKQRPYSVVLFDEIEKAHTDVQNLLLQILEEGEVTDATGRSVSFRHTVVIMTSNIGLERFTQGGLGFASNNEEKQKRLKNDLQQELKERLRPELVNRIDKTCIFQPLDTATLQDIVTKRLDELRDRVQEQREIDVTVNDEVISQIVKEIDAESGARDVRRLIQDRIETAIADRLLRGKRKPKRLSVKLKRGKIKAVENRG
jgi:ATP-dependent Clp protease ATP-binding subunit ClpC